MRRSQNGTLAILLISLVAVLAIAGCDGVAATPTPTGGAMRPTPTTAPPPTATRPAAAVPTPSAERPIVVSEPQGQQSVSSPVRVAGLARVFEATVRIEVADAQGNVIGKGFATATAGGPEVGSFSTQIAFTAPAQSQSGKIRVFGDDPRDGGRVGLVEIPVSLAPASASASSTLDVEVYFTRVANNDVQYVPATRTIPRTQAVGRAALTELLAGPTAAERQRGLETTIPAGVQLRSLRIEGGTAYADFDEKLQAGVGGATRTAAIRQQITRTLLQFSTVQKVVISIEGRTEDILQP